MLKLKPGLHQIKNSIAIHAPVECCYQDWIDSPHLPDFMRRVLGVEFSTPPGRSLNPVDEIDATVEPFYQTSVSPGLIKHWLVYGPGGKLYEVEKTVILEIPNRFYCTTSADPKDLSVQSSLFFSPDDKNKNTYIEWEVSFWTGGQCGSLTHLVSDILVTGDSFYKDCLQDFKTHVEAEQALVALKK